MPAHDSSCFTKTGNVVGDPQQNVSMTCSWNILGKRSKKRFCLAWFFFFLFTFQNLAMSETRPCRCFCSLTNSCVRRNQEKWSFRCWWRTTGPELNCRDLSTDAGFSEHSHPRQGGKQLQPVSCRACGGCFRFGPQQMVWKFLHPEGHKTRKSLAKSTWEKKNHILIGISNDVGHCSSLVAEKGC